MRCIAIDDEPIALSIIKQFCERRGDIELQVYTNPQIGVRYILEQRPDLVLLDIEMNGTSGIELAALIPRDCCLVFTTAHANYALDGFELNAIDFLHKPFSYSRFERAIEKVQHVRQLRAQMKESEVFDSKITVKVEYKNVTLSTENILYIEAMDNYIKIYQTTEQRAVVSQMSLKGVMQLLPAREFLRVHKSYIIALNKVESFTRRQVTLSHNAVSIPVGRMFADKLCEVLK